VAPVPIGELIVGAGCAGPIGGGDDHVDGPGRLRRGDRGDPGRRDTLKLDAGTVPKSTWVAPLKPVPLMVTVVPPAVGPDACESDETTGSVRT
jgi:hypothetical protein